MSTLEDKILGNKAHNYCSSSESGDESEEEGNEMEECNAAAFFQKGRDSALSINNIPEPSKWDGVSSNTGPKGVLKDWQRFKQLESEKRKEQDVERIELMKKLSITCKSSLDEEKNKKQKYDDEFSELLSDEFLHKYRQQRMNEMLSNSSNLPRFGKLYNLVNGEQFLEAVDGENKYITVVIHIYEEHVPGCKTMNRCLTELSQDYVQVKFCKLLSTSAGMSKNFKVGGVPALLIYKGGQMVGNFVRVTDDLGDEFYVGDVENFLIEHGMIVDKSCIPNIVYQQKGKDFESDVCFE